MEDTGDGYKFFANAGRIHKSGVAFSLHVVVVPIEADVIAMEEMHKVMLLLVPRL